MNVIKQTFEILTPINEVMRINQRLENAGRVCYKSEGSITIDSANKFIKRIINNGHESVLEHMSLSIKFITDRATANALVRHRHCAFSQESTHYIDYIKKYGGLTFIEPEGAYLGREENPSERILSNKQRERIYKIYEKIEEQYLELADIGQYFTRMVLPLGLKTELVMTTNMREWRHILKIRTEEGCHPQMRALMTRLYFWFKITMPIFVSDFMPYSFNKDSKGL